MKFGPASPADALGGVTVHTLRQGSLVLKKGTTIGPDEVAALTGAGVKDVVVVRLEDGDVSEDVAAASIAQAVAGEGVNVERAFTGRANLFAGTPGVLVVDRAIVDRINAVDEAITFATLAAYKPVVEGEMIATVKLIPFGVAGTLRDAAVQAASGGAMRIAPYTVKKVGIVSTLLPGLSPKVIDKTLRVTEERLAPAGAKIIAERRVPHDEKVLAKTIKELLGLGAELVIVFGASAIADRRDVIPSAIEQIGGAIEHFGMPVDPGNLLLIGRAGNVPVLGAPGCARSPVENGFDWVLMRLLAGLKVTRGSHRHGRRRFADGNRHPAATARARRQRWQQQRRRRYSGRRPFDPDGRAEQAARRTQRQGIGPDRRRTGDRIESVERNGGDRSSGARGREGAGRTQSHVRLQP
jgi:molybdenum cofactor cytidylyltransferase